MFYKIFNGQEILDVINNPLYFKTLENGARVSSTRKDAEGVLSSDESTYWYIEGWKAKNAPNTVLILEITQSEYEQLRGATKLAKIQKKKKVESTEPTIPTLQEITSKTIQERKIELVNEECSKRIIEGVDVTLSDGQSHHFDLTLEDQINLLSLQTLLSQGVNKIPYHSKGQPARLYSQEDIQTILAEVEKYRLYHITYVNALKHYIYNVSDINVLEKIHYGMNIPEEYQTEALKSLLK